MFDSPNTANIKITIGAIPQQLPQSTLAYTYTTYNRSSIFDFEQGKLKNIRINPNILQNATTLEIARMLIHEIIHAELINRCIELGFIESMNSLGNVIFVDDPINNTIQEIIFNFLLTKYNAFEPSSSPNTNPNWNHDLFNAVNYRLSLAQDLVNIHPLLNDTNNDFLNLINNNPNNVGGTYTLDEVMNYISWIGLEGTSDYLNSIVNTQAELNNLNFIKSVLRDDYNMNCNN